MANFQTLPGGQKISGLLLTVTKTSIMIGLWGYLDFNNQELDVVSTSPAVKIERKGIVGNCRQWLITPALTGIVRVEARTKDGGVWDWVGLEFMALQGATQVGWGRQEDKDAILAAVKAGRIQGATAQLTAVINNGFFDDGQHSIVLADGMYPVLAALSRSNTLSLLSLMRFGEGPHGKIRAYDAAVCAAMDIKAYAGFSINLINGENVDDTISGIAKVITNLPAGLYALGLTRPSPNPNGPPMPDKDVFLPMDPKKGWPMYKCGLPLANPTPQFVNPDAAEAINTALSQNPQAKMNRMFQDGPDHMHLEVISAKSA